MNTMNDHEYAYHACISHHPSKADIQIIQSIRKSVQPTVVLTGERLEGFTNICILYVYTLTGTYISNRRVANHCCLECRQVNDVIWRGQTTMIEF